MQDNFIAAVKEGRGERLRPEEAARLHLSTLGGAGCAGLFFGGPSKGSLRRLVRDGVGLFDGSVYSGEVGKEIGLVDGVGEMQVELRNRYGKHVRLETVEEEQQKLDYAKLLRWLL